MALFKVLTEKPERKIFKMQKKLLQNPDIISVLGLGQVKKQNLLIFSTAYTCRIAGSLITHEKVFQRNENLCHFRFDLEIKGIL